MVSKSNPWSHYWQSQTGHACIASDEGSYSNEIVKYWHNLIEYSEASKILDLCTGNGAVPRMLQEVAQHKTFPVEITGVDSAEIIASDLTLANGQNDSSCKVTLLSGISIDDLPFEKGNFDLLTGQFAVEYCDFNDTFREAARVLKPGARAVFLMHHVKGKSVIAAHQSLEFIANVETSWQYFSKVEEYVKAMCDYRVNGGDDKHSKMKTNEQIMMIAFNQVSGGLNNPELAPIAFNLTDVIRHMLKNQGAFSEQQMLNKIDDLANTVAMQKQRLFLCADSAINMRRQEEFEAAASFHGFTFLSSQMLKNEEQEILAVSNQFEKI